MGHVAMVGCPFFVAPHVHIIVFKDGFLGFVVAQSIQQQEADRWRNHNSAGQWAAACHTQPHFTLAEANLNWPLVPVNQHMFLRVFTSGSFSFSRQVVTRRSNCSIVSRSQLIVDSVCVKAHCPTF